MSNKVQKEIDLTEYGVGAVPLSNKYVPPTSAYANSSWRGTQTERDAFAGPLSLNKDRTPTTGIEHESTTHRLMLYLKAKGASNREVATILQYSETHVSQITRQPWFRKRLCDELHTAGLDAIKEVLGSAVLDSVYTLISVRDTALRPSDRAAAANSLIDRVLGKPVQRVETKNENFNVTSTRIDELEKQISLAEEERRRLVGATATSSTETSK